MIEYRVCREVSAGDIAKYQQEHVSKCWQAPCVPDQLSSFFQEKQLNKNTNLFCAFFGLKKPPHTHAQQRDL